MVKLNPLKIVIIVGHKKEQIIKKVTEEYQFKNIEFVEQTETLGTAHAVLQTLPSLSEFKDYNSLILYGDKPCISYNTLQKLFTEHFKNGNDGTLLTYFGETSTKKCGRIIRDVSNKISEIYEDENVDYPSNEFNGGIQTFKISVLQKYIPLIDKHNAQEEYYLPDIIKLVVKDGGKISNVCLESENGKELLNVNTQDDIKKAEKVMFN